MINFKKIKRVASILLVFFIVLSTNLVDQKNYNRLKKSVTNIYKDRIVASDLLFEIVLLVHEKEIAIISSDTQFFQKRNKHVNNEINQYVLTYDETKLTEKEHGIFNDLKKELNHLKVLEEKYEVSDANHKNKTLQALKSIKIKLQNLSKIQIDEGKQEMLMSNKAMKTIDIFTNIEIIFLVIMAILVQIIILYNPKKSKHI